MLLEFSSFKTIMKGSRLFDNRFNFLLQHGKHGQVLALYYCLFCHKLKSMEDIQFYLQNHSEKVSYLLPVTAEVSNRDS